MGSHFHIPIYSRLDNQQTSYFLNKSNIILLADSDPDKNPIDYSILNLKDFCRKFSLNTIKHITLVIGSESTGISLNMRNYKNENSIISSIKIPLYNTIESLNCSIAFAILGYEIRKLIIDFNNFKNLNKY
jgi:tRNA G18 (ribose-2'-O)-methylase SpoU